MSSRHRGILRRDFIARCTGGASALAACSISSCTRPEPVPQPGAPKPGSAMRFGLVTYQWGRDWDLPTLIENCEKTRVLGVELRTTQGPIVLSISRIKNDLVKKPIGLDWDREMEPTIQPLRWIEITYGTVMLGLAALFAWSALDRFSRKPRAVER